MTELTYPAFPRKALVAIGAALVALCAVALVINGSGPDERGCAIAAERVMAARNYSVFTMSRMGPDRLPACRGLTAGQYGQAVADGYRLEYGGRLPSASIARNVPPPSFRALSAQTALSAR